jgi:hypothetical protein
MFNTGARVQEIVDLKALFNARASAVIVMPGSNVLTKEPARVIPETHNTAKTARFTSVPACGKMPIRVVTRTSPREE